MRASYMLPSGTYNLILSEENLEQLLFTGRLVVHTNGTPCTTANAVWNPDTKRLETVDKKEAVNDLRFCTNETVQDIRDSFPPVQFLNIVVEPEAGERYIVREIFERLHAHCKYDGHTVSVWKKDLISIAKEYGIDLTVYDFPKIEEGK